MRGGAYKPSMGGHSQTSKPRISWPFCTYRRKYILLQRGPCSSIIFAALMLMAVLVVYHMGNPVGGVPSKAFFAKNIPLPTLCAYVFYGANDNYCCAAMVNMARLRRFTGRHALPPNVDLVLIVSDTVSLAMQHLARDRFGAVIYRNSDFGVEHAMSPPIGKYAHFYTDCFQKFRAFLLPADVYRRLIFLDADCLILRPPHHLFDLPSDLALAAPQAYWYVGKPLLQDTAFWQEPSLRHSRQDFLTTWMMSVRPSITMYKRLQARNKELIDQGVQDVYDMDLFNVVFGQEITALPAEYALLDLELTGAHDIISAGVDIQEALNGTQGWAIHFSAGKPMTDFIAPQKYPRARAAYDTIIQTWYREASDICPLGTYPAREEEP